MKLKNKHGFTLIELLAVIVVLAIIALIATPIVMNTIKSAKKGAAERSADSYIKQVETAVATERLEGNVLEGEYAINSNGNICENKEADCGSSREIEIAVSGNKPKSGTVTIENGQVTLTSKLDMGDYDVTYDSENKKYVASEKGSITPDTPTVKTYTNGEEVYFNVDNGTKCTSSEAVSTTGTKSGCMKFYAFNDDGGDTVNLLLDHNTTPKIAWNSSNNNTSGPSEVLTQLKTDTSSWQGTLTPANYTMDQTGQTSNAKYTIDYSEYKARLITANEVAQITGNTTWDEKVAGINDSYFFDTNAYTASDTCKNGDTSGCQYGWLYDRTITACTKWGCLNNADSSMTGYGYWTSSARADTDYSAWDVYYTGKLGSGNAGGEYTIFYGVRPVIEVSKSQLG